MDSKNGTWYIPNKKLINEVITLHESPIELKKMRKKSTLNKVESNETSLSIEKKTPLASSLENASDDYELKKRERKEQL